MRRHHRGVYVIALAVLSVGVEWAFVSASTLLFNLVLVACLLMLLFMHAAVTTATMTDRDAAQRLLVSYDDPGLMSRSMPR